MDRDADRSQGFEDDDDDRSSGRRGGSYGGPRGGGAGRRPKHFYKEQIEKAGQIDYKNIELLRFFITERGKIRPRRQTGVSGKEQRTIARAIKRARHMALLPYTSYHMHDS